MAVLIYCITHLYCVKNLIPWYFLFQNQSAQNYYEEKYGIIFQKSDI